MKTNLKLFSKIISFVIFLALIFSICASATGIYTVQSGDSLWKISRSYNTTVANLKEINSLTSDNLSIGQKLLLAPAIKYIVKSGDSLWYISTANNTTVTAIKDYNNLTSDILQIGQVLYIPTKNVVTPSKPSPVLYWPSVTYIVKAGDSLSSVAVKYSTTVANVMKYNYMRKGEWLNEGQKIAINGYAPRNYAVMPNESAAPLRVGKLVDWFLDGKYLIKRNDIFLITDVKTGLQLQVKMLGGLNHSDVETLTTSDSQIMKTLFPVWNWAPRPVVIFHNGINFAASLSGMPHSYDTITNGIAGHFDLYLLGSTSHGTASAVYLQQHRDCIMVATGLK